MNFLIPLLLLSNSSFINIAVKGEGYFRFLLNGQNVYSKKAQLVVIDQKICDASGASIYPSLWVSRSPDRLEVGPEGSITGYYGSHQAHLGRILLTLFPSGTALMPEKQFLVSTLRGISVQPEEEGAGSIETVESEVLSNTTSKKPIQTSVAQVSKKSAEKTENKKINRKHQIIPRSEKPKIYILNQPAVGPGEYLLDEIAEIHADAQTLEMLKKVKMGLAPAIGVSQPISRYQILSSLRAAQFKPEDFDIVIPSYSRIIQTSQSIADQEFINYALKVALEKFKLRDLISAQITRPMLVPHGKVQFTTEKAHMLLNRVSITVEVYVDDKKINSRTVHLVREVHSPLIRPGSTVKLVVASHGARVETTGKALSGGNLADEIKVSTEQKVTLFGKITDHDKVEVRV